MVISHVSEHLQREESNQEMQYLRLHVVRFISVIAGIKYINVIWKLRMGFVREG